VDVAGVVGGSLLIVLMIEASHPLHTHTRSSSYIYKVFQHLLQWLVVIRMQHHTDMLGLAVTVVVVGHSLGFSLVICCML
jgi:hypothetical protein